MPKRYGATAARGEEERLLDVARCDHYSSGSDDESGGGGGGGRTRGRRRAKNGDGSGKFGCCRALAGWLLLPLLLLASLSLFYSYRLQNQLTSLSSQLSSAQSDIAALTDGLSSQSSQLEEMNATLADHSAVIARFENSVSNSDVLQKLEELEASSKEREAKVESEMNSTWAEIRGVLSETKKEIDATVSNATNEINFQVSSVQSALSSYIRTTQDQFSTENSFMVYQLAGTMTLLGCLISMWHMTSHLRNFREPFVQRKILAILWMCPIYSVTSWLSLVAPASEGYLAILKDLYEAYVIYQFLSFCIAVLGKGDRNAVVESLAHHADHLSPPMRCCGWFRKKVSYDLECEDEKKLLAEEVLLQCQMCAAQFVFLRPLLTAILFVLKKVDYHGPLFGPGSPFDHSGVEYENEGSGGMLDYRSPQCYLTVLENISVFLAFSGLLKFYHAVQEDLSWCRPFPKFLCIKGVVFMTFWQGIAISLLANTTDLLSGGGDATLVDGKADDDQVETWAMQAQNFLICLEMLGFSIAHFYCFPVEEWEEGYRPVEDKSKFGDKMAIGDFLHDLKTILKHKETKKRRAKGKAEGRLKSDDSISTVLEEDEELGRTDSSDGLQSLLDNVEDLLEGEGDAASGEGAKKEGDPSPGKARIALVSNRSVRESLRDANAPKELRQATAVLLAGNLLDETTARLLTNDIMELEAGSRGDVDDGGEGRADERIPGGGESEEPLGDHAETEEATAIVPTAEGDTRPSAPRSPPPPPPSSDSALLPPALAIDDVLRPSIFTMSPNDEDEADRGESFIGRDTSLQSDSNSLADEGDAKPPESNSLWSGVS